MGETFVTASPKIDDAANKIEVLKRQVERYEAENGILIKHLPATCGSSLWEHKEGYSSDRGVMCFVYHDTLGLRNNWYSYL